MIYRYCSTSGFDILLNNRLRASKIFEFNDPFELAFGIDTSSAVSNVRKDYYDRPALLDAWKTLLREQQIEFAQDSAQDIIEKIAAFQIFDLRRIGKQIREGWNEKMGVACFSREFDIIQMWAHYADNHKGIVIGIDETEIMSDPRQLAEVEYNDEFVCFPVFANPERLALYEPYIMQAFHRKEKRWQYEKEVRFYINLDEKASDGHYYKDIPASSIKVVYLGLRAHETTKIIAKEIASRPHFAHLNVFQMEIEPDKYKLKPNPI
jgi:hypothetical protein